MTAPGAPETPKTPGAGLSYAASGVSIDAGDRAVALMKAAVRAASRPEVVGGIGGFAGLFDASKLASYRRPLLATSTDGVGTKVVIAQRLGRYDTVGIDLVGMVVDDLATCGAEPLFMTDYVVFGRLDPERAAAVVAGVAEGCVRAGCALIGGETAEHPGHLDPDDFDLAGAATGVVEADRLLGAHRVRAGDAVIGLASSGLHANGYSLARRVLDGTGLALDAEPPELGTSVGEELLTPTAIYARDCLALAAAAGVRPASRARRDRRGRDGAGVQHGRRHGGRAGSCRRRPGSRHAGQPECPGVGDGRARARRWHCPAGRPARALGSGANRPLSSDWLSRWQRAAGRGAQP